MWCGGAVCVVWLTSLCSLWMAHDRTGTLAARSRGWQEHDVVVSRSSATKGIPLEPLDAHDVSLDNWGYVWRGERSGARSLDWAQNIGRRLPLTRWLKGYGKDSIKRDAIAGITVGVMLVPQAMAYATIAGMPPVYGLYASLVPLLLYPLFGSCRHIAAGPIAIDMLIVAAGLGALATPGSARYIELALMLAAMVGILQIAMGALRLGFVASLLSKPVIVGFTSAAALVIAASQIGNLLGLSLEKSSQLQHILAQLPGHLGAIEPMAAALGAMGIILMLGLKRWKPRWPRALIVVVIGSLVCLASGLGGTAVKIVGDVPRGLPSIGGWSPDTETIGALFPIALTLAVIQFMDTISLARAFAQRHGDVLKPNQELFALGAMNFGGSFFGSIPVSASFSRTAINESSGAVSPLSNVVAAALVLGSLLFLTPLVRLVPMPVLAAIIIASTVGMLDIQGFRDLWGVRKRDAMVALVTFTLTLTVGIQEGIAAGVLLSVLNILYVTSRPQITELAHIEGSHVWRDRERFPEALSLDNILVVRVEAPFSFANAEYLNEFLLAHPRVKSGDLDTLILDARLVSDMDTTAVDALSTLRESLDEFGVELRLCGAVGSVRDVMFESGLSGKIGWEHLHIDVHEAVVHALVDLGDRDALDAYLSHSSMPYQEVRGLDFGEASAERAKESEEE